jgi:hypothetical protein
MASPSRKVDVAFMVASPRSAKVVCTFCIYCNLSDTCLLEMNMYNERVNNGSLSDMNKKIPYRKVTFTVLCRALHIDISTEQ